MPDVPMPKPVVLIVDDEPAIVRAITRVLSQKFEIITAPDASAAYAACAGRDVALVVSDYMMPGHNGLTLIRALRARAPGMRAVLVTAVPHLPEIDAALRAGEVQEVMGKPWSSLCLLREAMDLARR